MSDLEKWQELSQEKTTIESINQPKDNISFLFDEGKKKYQRPDEIDRQMLHFIKNFDWDDLWLLYKAFKQWGDGFFIDTHNIKTISFPTGRADKEKTAPLFDWNEFFAKDASLNGKYTTNYRILPAGRFLISRMDQNPELVEEQKLHDLTLLFRSGEANIVRAISKNGEMRVLCFSHEAIQEIEEIKKVLYLERHLQEKYWLTKEQTKTIIEMYKDTTKDIQEILDIIENAFHFEDHLQEKYWRTKIQTELILDMYKDNTKNIEEILDTVEKEYAQYGEHWPWKEPTSEYLYHILMTAEEIPTTEEIQ